MTSKTSSYNFGLYKNILRRFKWGSFLYFVLLFLSVPFAFLVEGSVNLLERYTGGNYMGYLLTRGDYITIPVLLAMVVPTIMTVLCYNNVHSEKQGIFEHALPITRKKAYIQSLLASFTLMAVPVILNGIILLIMSFSGYGQLFYPHTVFVWMAFLLTIIFIMFSVAVFSAFLTGNAASHIAINVFFHLVPFLVALTIYIVSETFLFGFMQSDNFITNKIIAYIPVSWLFSNASNIKVFSRIAIYAYILGAVILYLGAYVLYKNRKIEACGDVAAFWWFRPILKYSVSASVAIIVFSVFTPTIIPPWALFVLAGVLTLIAYFATEMLMNKTFKVFGAYKGYLGFAAFVAIFISFFAYTEVFGYETRVPDFSDIESASVYRGSKDNAIYVDKEAEIETVRDIHKSFVSDIKARERDKTPRNRFLSITYKLKNGGELSRRYNVSNEENDLSLGRMYEIMDYKLGTTGIDRVNIENVKNINIYASANGYHETTTVLEDVPKILTAVKKDIEMLSYKEIEENGAFFFNVYLGISAEENEKLKYFKTDLNEDDKNARFRYENFEISINSNFKNTVEVLKETGYYDRFVNSAAGSALISKIPARINDGEFSYKDDTGDIYQFFISRTDCKKIEEADAIRIIEDLFEKRYEPEYNILIPETKEYAGGDALPNGEDVYFVFIAQGEDNISVTSHVSAYTNDSIPPYLKKYI